MTCRWTFLEEEPCGGEPKPRGDRSPFPLGEVCEVERTGLPVVVVVVVVRLGNGG